MLCYLNSFLYPFYKLFMLISSTESTSQDPSNELCHQLDDREPSSFDGSHDQVPVPIDEAPDESLDLGSEHSVNHSNAFNFIMMICSIISSPPGTPPSPPGNPPSGGGGICRLDCSSFTSRSIG